MASGWAVPLPGSASYAATKHGIVGLTESLRIEYGTAACSLHRLIQPAQVETAMLEGQARPRAASRRDTGTTWQPLHVAVRRNRFEVWVPASQAVSARLGLLLPRRAREALLRALGVGRIAGKVDSEARQRYDMFTRGTKT